MWSWSYLLQCWKARHSGQCSRTCHRHHSSQSGSRGRMIHSCLSRSGHQNWGPHSSTNSRCSATPQKRSLGRCKYRSTGLVTGISKNSLILLLCWCWHNTQLVGMDLRRQSPKIPWPRRQWPRSKRACTWRRETARRLSAGRFQQEGFHLGTGC